MPHASPPRRPSRAAITKTEELRSNYLIVYLSCASYLVIIRRVRKEELMVQRLSLTELVTGVLLFAALTWAAVQLAPTALARWF